VEFDAGKKILAMFSAEKEKVKFSRHVDPNKKNVEDWMGELEEMMKVSIKDSLLFSINDYPKRRRSEWAVLHPGQCVLNGSQVQWTTEVEASFKTNTVKDYWDVLNQFLVDLVELVRQKL
jgi:dynein heavy chain, axonemal